MPSQQLPDKVKALLEARATVARLEIEVAIDLGLNNATFTPVPPAPVPVAPEKKRRLSRTALPVPQPKAGRRRFVTTQKIARVQALRESGKTVREIAAIMALSKSAVNRALYGATGAAKPAKGGAGKRLTPDIIAQVLEYRANKKTVPWICKELGLSKSSVGRALSGKTKAAREVKASLDAVTPPAPAQTETAQV